MVSNLSKLKTELNVVLSLDKKIALVFVVDFCVLCSYNLEHDHVQ